ncbi:hypothetical protein BGX27_003688 [Mortierella sp. AM989]|nr:hypothetical protein BGX27_003688 [Mortierella sp. AM989]
MVNLNLFCLVDNNPISNAFPLSIPSTSNIGILKKRIKEEKTPEFDNFSADKLILYRVSIPDTDEYEDIPILLNTIDDKKKLRPTDELSDIFGDKSPDKKTIHIMVQPPLQGIQNKDTQQIKDLLREAKDEMLTLQRENISLTKQAVDRLVILQKHVQAILIQNFELHEYPIPRLFIILPVDRTKWNPKNVLQNRFRLHFLCECGEYTVKPSERSHNHIHIAKHEGYEIRSGTEFFSKYGNYMLILLQYLKIGASSSALTPIPSLIDAGIDYLIGTMNALSIENSVLNDINTIGDYEGLEGADLRQLGTFLRINDEFRKLGNLYRITTEAGHVKWVCIDHYRLTYKEKEQIAFTNAVEVNGGNYDSQLHKVTVTLGSRIRAEEFFNALAKARHVYDLDLKFDWHCSRADLEAFEKALKMSISSKQHQQAIFNIQTI